MAVTGGIAAYKSAELVRLLRKQGEIVQVAMTRSAMQFVSPLTFEALTGYPVYKDLFGTSTAAKDNYCDNIQAMEHINLARWADILIIAPATANIIAKCSHGIADDLVSTLYLATSCPVYIAPAMNQAMWHKAIVQENILKLKGFGVTVIGPEQGDQACGDIGFGRMSEPGEICSQLQTDSQILCLNGLKVLVSAGPTREPLDPVRYITNRSSGKMGYAIATAAQQAGAKVTLISGPVALNPPDKIEVVHVETAAQMHQAIISRAAQHDIYIGAAAVADYTPAHMEDHKIKKQDNQTTVTLQKTQDILADVANIKIKRPFVVGFAAETHDLDRYAQDKLQRKNLDMIAANWVGQEKAGFESEQNALRVFWKNGQQDLPLTDKKKLAKQLINLIANRLEQTNEKNTA